MKTATEAEHGWHEARTPRFVVLTDGEPERARRLATDLERFHQVMLAKTSVEEREAAPPFRVFLTSSRESYRALGGDEKTAGQFKPTVRGNYALVSGGDDDAGGLRQTARHVLFHEYVHYLQSLGGGHSPGWYREGVAEYMATTELRDDGSYTVGCPPRHRTAWAADRYWIPMREVMQSDNLVALSGRDRDAYAQAWYAVHYFSGEEERVKQMAHYLALWAAGRPYAEAVQEAFGMPAGALNVALQEYARKPSFDCAAVTPAEPLKAPEVAQRPLIEAQASYRVADLLLATVGANDAVFELLRRGMRASPRNGRIRAALARAHLMRAQREAHTAGGGDAEAAGKPQPAILDEALGHVEAALALEPDEPEVRVVEGHVLAMRAALQKGRDVEAAAASLGRARNAYRRAIKADEGMAEAYFGLGQTYLVADSGSKEAVVVLEAAAYLVPLAAPVAFTLAQVRMQREQFPEAIAPLQYAARWAKQPGLQAAAQELLAQIRKAAAMVEAARMQAAEQQAAPAQGAAQEGKAR
ncbi:MAG: hypothetical protein PVI30_10530 [Myxococcales bacterium]